MSSIKLKYEQASQGNYEWLLEAMRNEKLERTAYDELCQRRICTRDLISKKHIL